MATWSANKICNRIVTTLVAYDKGGGSYPFKDKTHNHFADVKENYDVFEYLLHEAGHIFVFYTGQDTSVVANNMITGSIYLEFWVIDQVVGVSGTKEDFQADELRAYLTSASWRSLGITTDYASNNFRHFMLESERVAQLLDSKGNPSGKIVTIFRGRLDYDNTELS